MKWLITLVAFMVLSAGCGQGEMTAAEDYIFGELGEDTAPGEPEEPWDVLEPPGLDLLGEAGDARSDIGGFGWPCEDSGDCLSGWCVPESNGEGFFCTIPCVEDCPGDMTCRQAPQTLPDLIYICLPSYPAAWCRPCRDTGDCADPWADSTLTCEEVSVVEGSFCTQACEEDASCPEGFSCEDGRCLPPGGCTCLEGPDATGWETDCAMGGSLGLCAGVRVCTENGMSGCSAALPSPEVCNGLDDDCDGQVDPAGSQGCSTWWLDEDGDGVGGDESACLCEGTLGWALISGDCDDTDAGVSPITMEICDGLDQDCDGTADEAPAFGCVTAWLDEDGDGWGGPKSACLCVPAAPYVLLGTDCNDTRDDIYPGAPEICDGADQDCNGVEDAACDEDGDGWCAGPHPENPCIPGALDYGLCLAVHTQKLHEWCPLGFGDCDDEEPAAYPGAAEICDGVDNDCDGVVDEDLDMDGDGYCVDGFGACCEHGGGDCDDSKPWIHPGAEDLPDMQLVDSNCDGIDGDIADAIFVHGVVGYDYLPGTMFMPKQTIQGGIEEAAFQGKGQVLVAMTLYEETLTLTEGVGVYGRYTAEGGWKRHGPGINRADVVSPESIAVYAITIEAATTLAGLEIAASDASMDDGASVAVFADGSPGLTLRDLALVTGNGWSGEEGGDGDHGEMGESGEDGHKGCNVPSCIWGGTCSSGTPFGGGYQYLCNAGYCACGGMGQNYSTWTMPESTDVEFSWLQGDQGQHSCWYRQHGPGKGGEGGSEGFKGHSDGFPGQDGVQGDHGPAGALAPFGNMASYGWIRGKGGLGWSGARGSGGGGGGKGRNRDQGGLFECNTLGGEGGGGGEGGVGGTGGSSGYTGASVFGVLLRDAPILIEECRIDLGHAGHGGTGGHGGEGGLGGLGGAGGKGYKNSGIGGDGGEGGRGGAGGGGAGGRGGHSVGILWTCGAAPSIDGFEVNGGTSGEGGQGGLSLGNDGPDGADGVHAETWCID